MNRPGFCAVFFLAEGFGYAQETPNRLNDKLRGAPGRGWLILQGVVSILAGLAAIILPGLAGLVGGLFTLWTIVIYSIVHGAMGIASATDASDGVPSSKTGGGSGGGKAWGIASGVITLLFGILLAVLVLVTPGVTLLGLIWTVAIYAIVFGVVLIVAAIQVRRGVRQSARRTAAG